VEPHEVLFCIEHEARELDVACAVRAIAREKYGVNIRLHFLTNELSPSLSQREPSLVVVPSCTTREFAHKEVFQKLPRVPLLNIACEQLFSPANRQYRLPRDQFAREHVLHLAAGEFFRDWLLDSGVPRPHIALTGSATFQLYRHPYRTFYDCRREAIAAAHGLQVQLPWILLPENFGAAFFKPSHVRKRVRGGYDRQELAAYIEYTQRSFRKIAAWCGEVAATGRVELIIRPRPAVSRTVFTSAFLDACQGGQSRHLHFIKEGSVREWIFASQMVLSSYSTTLLEAAVAGRPAYLLAPYPVPKSASSDWHEFTPQVSDLDTLQQLIHHPESAAVSDHLRRWAQARLLSHGDAIENIARIISDICRGKRMTPNPYPRPSAFSVAGIREGLRQTEKIVRRAIRPNRVQNFVYNPTDVSHTAVDERTKQWAQLLSDARQCHVA
jgi:surface carbohydrate biosynthesis protein